MRTIDNNRNYTPPGQPAPRILTLPSEPSLRRQKLNARFRDEAIKTETVLKGMNGAARRMWSRPA